MAAIDYRRFSDSDDAVRIITNTLNGLLKAKKRVLWLVAGGSAAPLAAAVSRSVADGRNLTVTLTDERYGPAGHPDSNWVALAGAGFKFDGIRTRPILEGKPFKATVADWNAFLASDSKFDFVFGLFGMGADGHTAGILPRFGLTSSKELAVGYQGPDYQRITATTRYISSIDEAIVYAAGAAKQDQIRALDNDLDLEEQPVQIMKTIPKVTFINDYKGEML
jgi:6-phosphogluconolactonase/glucosamine-6-phosphate isomerase/deaminase